MKKNVFQFFLPFLLLLFCVSLLINSKDCISLASQGLLIWYRNMIPSLFPFMVLSGFFVSSNLSHKIGNFLKPVLSIFLPLPSSMLYTVFMGFFCGFPMGAKVTADLVKKRQITVREGQYLLGFCNNIGPLYLLGYVIPLFSIKSSGNFLFLMYLVPFIYGIILKPFYISKKSSDNSCSDLIKASASYPLCFQNALSDAIEQITMLGGCMVFFNCIQILPKTFLMIMKDYIPTGFLLIIEGILTSLIEIGGGLKQLHNVSLNLTTFSSFLPLPLLCFGGLSCMMQTFFIIKNTGLSLRTYCKHKIIQSCVFLILLFLLKYFYFIISTS